MSARIDLASPTFALKMCTALGGTPSARRVVASVAGVCERTLRRWEKRQQQQRPVIGRRGRRPLPVARSVRQNVIATLFRLGPCAGVNVVRGLYKSVPYRTIAKLKRRFVRVVKRRKSWHRKRLVWLRAGTVWATDFTHPAAALEQANNRLCLVRDLGSGAQLAAEPCRGERQRAIGFVLATLFAALGPPLVLKHDNGGAFVAGETRALLEQHGVVPLRSPPYTPQYNGACERAGGTLKQRIAHEAKARGDPQHWSRADIDAAMRVANTTARPYGANGPTPHEALAASQPVRPDERRAFQQTRAETIARLTTTYQTQRGTMPRCGTRAAILRKATQQALCKHDYLAIRRGRISTPVSTWQADTKA